MLMDCSGKNLVLTVTPNGVKETQLTNLNLNLNKRYFTKSLKIFINRNGTSYIEWRQQKQRAQVLKIYL
jgi:hypothetical protein